MAINQILQFGAGTGANVMTPEDYDALSARSTGFQSGVAKSVEVNTPLRQAAFIAAMIGQFIADEADVDVLDNGDVPGLLANYLSALEAQIQGLVASAAQAQALSDDSVLMTPKKLADAFGGANSTLAATGFQRHPNGLIEQWCSRTHTAGANGNQTLSFPFAFPNAAYAVGFQENSQISAGAVVWSVSGLTASGVTAFWNYSSVTGGTSTRAAFVRAIGS